MPQLHTRHTHAHIHTCNHIAYTHTITIIQMVEDFDIGDCVHQVELGGADIDAAFDGFVSEVSGGAAGHGGGRGSRGRGY